MKYFKKLVGERIYLSPRNVEDVEKLTIVSESFSKWYPSEGEIEVRFAFRNENEYAIWREDRFDVNQINQKLQIYFSHE